ncbi:MAG: hypothetical protein ABSE73_00400 [Planctomycetota bacterium]
MPENPQQKTVKVSMARVEVKVKVNFKPDVAPVPAHVCLRRMDGDAIKYSIWQPLQNGKCVFAVPTDVNLIEVVSLPPGFYYRYPDVGVFKGGIQDGATYTFEFDLGTGTGGPPQQA